MTYVVELRDKSVVSKKDNKTKYLCSLSVSTVST